MTQPEPRDGTTTSTQLSEYRRLRLRATLPDRCRPGPDAWREIAGTGVLLSAPHEAAHVRDGIAKWAEPGTGALAVAVARASGAAAMCTAPPQTGDPGWEEGSDYVKRAAEFAREFEVVIDLHMMAPRSVDWGIGLGPFADLARPFADVLADAARHAGLAVGMNSPFRAERIGATQQLQRMGIPALQLELAVACFDPAADKTIATWVALAQAVRTIVAAAGEGRTSRSNAST